MNPEFQTWRDQLGDPIYSTQNLLPLLRHHDPRVRTLAIVALTLKEDPRLLPEFVRLADDRAATYPCPERPELRGIGGPMKAQSVSDFAVQVVGVYLEAAGYHYGISGAPDQPGFAHYWAAHKDRSASASWFAVRLRELHGERAAARKRKVMADIATLPTPDRQWTLLWLAAGSADLEGKSSLLADEEWMPGCRQIGREALLQMLAGHVPVSDPDVQPRRNNNWPYRSMVEMVLRRCLEVFESQDSAEFLRNEARQRSLPQQGWTDPAISGWWAIGAARLDPARATEILRSAVPRFAEDYNGPNRAHIVAALWELGGASQQRFVLDWFYREAPGNCCITARRVFLRSVASARGGWPRLAQLVADRRFDALDWLSLETLVEIVNPRSAQPVIGDDLYRKASHPYGIGSVERQMKRAMQEFPRETQQLQVVLAEWRRNLRESAPRWGRPGPPWSAARP